MVRVFIHIHIAEVGSVRQGDPIAYVVNVFTYSVIICKHINRVIHSVRPSVTDIRVTSRHETGN